MIVDLPRNDDFKDSRRASFILRCWADTEGDVRLRLIDARSGVAYPLTRLSDLPELIKQLLFRRLEAPNDAPPKQADN